MITLGIHDLENFGSLTHTTPTGGWLNCFPDIEGHVQADSLNESVMVGEIKRGE